MPYYTISYNNNIMIMIITYRHLTDEIGTGPN